MKLLFISLFFSFTVSACQSFQNTRVILAFNEPVKTNEIEQILSDMSQSIEVENIALIRASNNKQLIVNVYSCKQSNYWLTELNRSAIIHYAEIDVKKRAH